VLIGRAELLGEERVLQVPAVNKMMAAHMPVRIRELIIRLLAALYVQRRKSQACRIQLPNLANTTWFDTLCQKYRKGNLMNVRSPNPAVAKASRSS
jgi:hypothetical protein